MLNLFYSSLELTDLFAFHNIAFICYYHSNVNLFFIKIKKSEDMFDCCGFQMSVWGFFDSLSCNINDFGF
jgi:hypothetical protein